MNTLKKYTMATLLLLHFVTACTPPEDQLENNNTPEVLATGDDTSARPDNDRE